MHSIGTCSSEIDSLKIRNSFFLIPNFSQFGCYNETVSQFLLGLNDTICQQIEVMSLDNTNDAAWAEWEKSCRKLVLSNSQLITILMRFRNVRSLRMLMPGLADLNTQHLFENCTKLMDIEFCLYLFTDEPDDIFTHIKDNCKDIRFIRVVAPRNKFRLSKWREVGQTHFPNINIEVKIHSLLEYEVIQ